MDVRVGLSGEELMLLNCGVGEDSWESLGLLRDPTSLSLRRSFMDVHWQDWFWSWNSNSLATWCEQLTHLKRSWSWERLRAGEEGDDRGWDGLMTSPTRWTWIWVISGDWWWAGGLGVLRFMGSQRVRHDWVNELNWTNRYVFSNLLIFSVLFIAYIYLIIKHFSLWQNFTGKKTKITLDGVFYRVHRSSGFNICSNSYIYHSVNFTF